MQILWYALYPVVWTALMLIRIVRNIPVVFYNLTHKQKRKYWHPVDWIMNDSFHPKFRGECGQEDIYE